MSNPEIPVIETISESIFKRSPVSKSVASATVSVVSVAENVVSVTVVAVSYTHLTLPTKRIV